MEKKKFFKWLKSTIIRALKTMAQTTIASIGTASAVMSELHWGFIFGTAGISGLISLLMSLENFPEDEK